MVIAEKIDSVGAILIVFMLSILVFTTVNVHTGTVLVTLGSYLAAFILMALFVMRENNISFPIIDFHLFANRAFIVGAAASLFLAVFYCVDLFFIPLHLHHLGYQSSMTIGLMLLPPSLMFAVLSLFSGKISATFGPRNTMLCGYVFFVASAVMQIVLGHSTNLIWLIAAYLLLGAGWALILSTAFGTALASLPAEMGGLGMGSIGTLHNLGGTIGLAVGSTLGYFGAMGFILAASVAAFVVIFVGLAKHGIDL